MGRNFFRSRKLTASAAPPTLAGAAEVAAAGGALPGQAGNKPVQNAGDRVGLMFPLDSLFLLHAIGGEELEVVLDHRLRDGTGWCRWPILQKDLRVAEERVGLFARLGPSPQKVFVNSCHTKAVAKAT